MIACVRRSLLWLLCGAVLLIAPDALRAASPRDELLRFVPEDVGFCFIMQDLRVHAADLADSPFVQQLRDSPVGTALQGSKELGQLDQIDKSLRQSFGAGFDQLRDDLLGDAVVFAYRPGPPDKPDQEQGLILVRARNAEVLASLVESINKTQKKDGSLTDLQACSYNGATYFRRVEPHQTNYYAIRGPVLLFTGQEKLLQQAIDVDRNAAADAEPPLARRLREVGADKAALALWVNPRAFDAGLEAKARTAQGTDAALQQKVLTYWKATDGVAAWATLDTALHLSLAIRVRPNDLPPAARRLFAAASRPSEAWRYFPDDALIACGFRIDVGALVEVLQDLQSKDDASAAANAFLGKDLIKDVLSHIGPDWGFCVMAPPAGSDGWLPEALIVVHIVRGDDAAPVDEVLLSTVHVAASWAVVNYNHDHPTQPVRLTATEYNKKEIHYLTGEGVFPVGVQPAYGLANGWLAFGSAPDVIRRFTDAKPKPPADDGSTFPLLRISVKAWRAYIKDHRDPLTLALAERNHLTPDEVRQGLDELLAAIQFVDRVEVNCRTGPGLTVLTLTVVTAQPLKRIHP
ncbi:MAG TPA: DUF3352 domain-containing protein [Gemmataceae bacterium]|nr:DUF3352 domain-containing protein [Gemmataceae bacterium]